MARSLLSRSLTKTSLMYGHTPDQEKIRRLAIHNLAYGCVERLGRRMGNLAAGTSPPRAWRRYAKENTCGARALSVTQREYAPTVREGLQPLAAGSSPWTHRPRMPPVGAPDPIVEEYSITMPCTTATAYHAQQRGNGTRRLTSVHWPTKTKVNDRRHMASLLRFP